MAEIWGMVGAAAIGLAGGVMSGRASKKQQKDQIAADKETVKLQGTEERKTLGYQSELADYYQQLKAQRNRDARASMYDKYSLVQKPEGFTRTNLAGPKPLSPDTSSSTSTTSRATPLVPPLASGQEPTIPRR